MEIKDLNFCFIGKDSVITGDLQLNGPSHIACRVEGSVTIETDNKIQIEPSAYILGKIDCHDIDVYGHVKGNINSTGTLRLFPSAVVEGEINSHSLIIKPGAIVNAMSATSKLAHLNGAKS